MRNKDVPEKKYSRKDGEKFMFTGRDSPLRDLSTTYKDCLCGDKSKWGKN